MSSLPLLFNICFARRMLDYISRTSAMSWVGDIDVSLLVRPSDLEKKQNNFFWKDFSIGTVPVFCMLLNNG